MTSLRLIKASGNAYDMGREIGIAVRDTVMAVSVRNPEFLALEEKWAGSSYVSQLKSATRDVYPAYMREIEGMADGMGLPFEQVFIWNCRGDLRLPDDMPKSVQNGAADGCTTLMIPGNLSDGQAHVIAHNEDGSDDLHGHCYWLSAKPNVGPAFESYLYPGMMPGHTLAVNARGLVQTINNIRVHDLKPGIPRHICSRAVLACSSLDDAVAILSRSDRASGFHHTLAMGGEERILSVEAPASGCEVKEITHPTAHANHLIYEPFTSINQSVTASSKARQTRAMQMLNDEVHMDSGPQAILFDRSQAGQTIHRIPGDGSDDYGRTLASGLFTISSDAVNWTLHDGPDNLGIMGGNVLVE